MTPGPAGILIGMLAMGLGWSTSAAALNPTPAPEAQQTPSPEQPEASPGVPDAEDSAPDAPGPGEGSESGPSEALEEDEFSEDEFDFDMSMDDISEEPTLPVSLIGQLRSSWGLWAERLEGAPWARGRQSLDLTFTAKWLNLQWKIVGHGEADLAYLMAADDQRPSTRDTYGWQVMPREAQVSWSAGPFAVTVGRQIVAWGEADMFSPLDLANPRDLREPGLADLDDIRMSALATRFSFFPDGERGEILWVHEADFGLRSPPFGPYSPLESVLGDFLGGDQLAQLLLGQVLEKDDIVYRHRQERFSLDGQQVLVRWVHHGEGLDLGLMAGRVLDQQGVMILPEDLSGDPLVLELDHRPYFFVGTTGALVSGSWLFKWELASEMGRAWNVTGDATAGVPEMGVANASRLLVSAGATWTPLQELSLGLEIMKPWWVVEPQGLLFDVDVAQLGLRVRWTGLHDRLVAQVVAFGTGARLQQGWLARGDLTYEILDGLYASLGAVTYQPGDELGPFMGLTSHDQLLGQLRWNFSVF